MNQPSSPSGPAASASATDSVQVAAPTYTLCDRLRNLPRQFLRRSPFKGSIVASRVPMCSLRAGRPSMPFPHPWNYREPLRILDSFFWNADEAVGSERHNRYLDVPGFAPVLVTRDPRLIRAISAETGDRPGQFDRDTLPSSGIARATGPDSLLYANGASWKRQKKLATPPFARTTLFQPEQFREFEETFRHTVRQRLALLRDRVPDGNQSIQVSLEPEIKTLMLEMLVNNFFGAHVAEDDVRRRYVPALECVIDYIVRDTVVNKLGIPLRWIPPVTRSLAEAKAARADFEHLTDLVLAPRRSGGGLWKQFESDAPDDALRSNIRVFLAGALEATTSYASWAISHLAREPTVQAKLFREIENIDEYTPGNLLKARYLDDVLNERLRLTPSLYFHPRRATADVRVETSSADWILIPRGTHILLDVWHANRHEDHWGSAATGHPATKFAPERWDAPSVKERNVHDRMHFGFGHGPRFCPGKSLGQLEVALVVGACVKLFEFTAVHPDNLARAGVSTKPADGVLVALRRRAISSDHSTPQQSRATGTSPPSAATTQQCPFASRARG